MTYDLRRLRLHGLIERIPHTHRYRPTPSVGAPPGSTTHAYNRFVRTGTADIADPASTTPLYAEPSTTSPPDQESPLEQTENQKLDSLRRTSSSPTGGPGWRTVSAWSRVWRTVRT
jgi:hypothetical protein